METFEIRCPVGTKKLFSKLRSDGVVTEGNLIEFSCSECKKLMDRKYNFSVKRVLHKYDFAGQLVESEILI